MLRGPLAEAVTAFDTLRMETTPLDALTASVAGMSRRDACAILPQLAALHAQIEVIAFSPGREIAEPDDGALLTVEQAAQALGMSSSYVYDHRQELGGRKLGRSVRFSRSALNENATKSRDNDNGEQRNRPREALRQVHRQIATR